MQAEIEVAIKSGNVDAKGKIVVSGYDVKVSEIIVQMHGCWSFVFRPGIQFRYSFGLKISFTQGTEM